MARASRPAPRHAEARHRGTRPDRVGRALRRALLATLVPAVLLAVAAYLVARLAKGRLIDVAVDPREPYRPIGQRLSIDLR